MQTVLKEKVSVWLEGFVKQVGFKLGVRVRELYTDDEGW